MTSRVFRGKDQKCWRVSVQVSFRNKALAQQFANQIDRVKAEAAVAGVTLSEVLLDVVLDADPRSLVSEACGVEP